MKTIDGYLYNSAGDSRLVLSTKKVVKSRISGGTYYRQEYHVEDNTEEGEWRKCSLLVTRDEFRQCDHLPGIVGG